MEPSRLPEVVREKISRVPGGRFSCALIFERELLRDEIARFYALPSDSSPAPRDFDLGGRVLSYECPEEQESQWRLAAEIFLVKAFRATVPQQPIDADLLHRPAPRPPQR